MNFHIYCLIAFFISSGMAFSQELLDSMTNQYIQEVVVTGSFSPTSAKQSVYQIKSIDQARIKQQGATRLQDVLAIETNLRFTQDLATGGSNISLQGIAGQNVKILLDGVPIVGRQGSSNEININQIDINTVARIEIVEGPMSVIYGADALAGVINIITKKAVEGHYDVHLKIHEETVNTAYGWPQGIHTHSIGGGYQKKDWYSKINFSRNAFGGYKGTAIGRDFQWHPKEQYMTGAVIGWDKKNTTAHFRSDYLYEDIFNPGTPVADIANDQHYFTNRWMNQLQLDHKLSSTLSLNASLAFTHFKRQIQSTTYNTINDDSRLSLAAGSQDTSVINGMMARFLLPWSIHRRVALLTGVDINIETGRGGRIANGTQLVQDYGLITSADITLAHNFKIKPGLRFIYNSVYNAPAAIPSLHAKWSISKSHDLKLAYGRGFRAPSIRELYFSFFDASHAIIGNTNLESELSHSYTASWQWTLLEKENSTSSTTISTFYNDINNMINFGQSPTNPSEVTYINIDTYKTKGISAAWVVRSAAHQINVSTSYIARQNLAADATTISKFSWSPEAALSYTYSIPKRKLTVGLFQKYTGRLPYFENILTNGTTDIRQAIIDDYFLTDLTGSKQLTKSMHLTLGIRNLFNVKQINNTSIAGGVHTGGGSQAIGYGRSFFLTASYTFSK